MSQNRNKLLDLFIGNIANAIIHKVLEDATKQEELLNKYGKELLTSLDIAKRYREKINPIAAPLPLKDISYIKNKITNKVLGELNLRITKGYKNIDLSLIEPVLNDFLKEIKII